MRTDRKRARSGYVKIRALGLPLDSWLKKKCFLRNMRNILRLGGRDYHSWFVKSCSSSQGRFSFFSFAGITCCFTQKRYVFLLYTVVFCHFQFGFQADQFYRQSCEQVLLEHIRIVEQTL